MDGFSPDHLGQVTIRASVSPARATYLIRIGSKEGFRRSVQEATTRWAGATEPIIAVGKSGKPTPWQRQLVELSRTDALVNVDLERIAAERVARELGMPLVELREIDRATITQFSTHPLRLEDPRGSFVVPAALLARRGAQLWEVAVAGDVTDRHESDLASHGLGFRRATTAEQVGRAQLTRGTALDLGLRLFGEYEGVGGPAPISTIVVVSRRNALPALLDYWNVRALSPVKFENNPVVLLPTSEYAHWLGFQEMFQGILNRPADFSPDVLLYGNGTGEQVDAIAQSLGLEITAEEPKSSHTFPPPPRRTAPFTYRRDVDPRFGVVFERRQGVATSIDIHLFRTGTRVRIDSPLPPTGPGQALLRLESTVFDDLPKRAAIADHIAPNATWSSSMLQFAIELAPRFDLTLTIPTSAEALQLVLREQVAQHSVSDKGQLGQALAARFTLAGLHSATTLRCIRALTTRRSKAFTDAVKHLAPDTRLALEPLATEWATERRRRIASARDLRPLCGGLTSQALEALAQAGWAERGLRIRCSSCRLDSFIPLPRVAGASAVCPGCETPGTFIATPDGVELHYRLDSLVDRASDQGILPHLVAIEALKSRYAVVHAIPAVVVHDLGRHEHEVDIIALVDGLILAAEVKTSASAFTDDEIAKDIERSSLLGAQIHLMAAVESIGRRAIETAQRGCDALGMELLVLAGEDLFPSDPFRDPQGAP